MRSGERGRRDNEGLEPIEVGEQSQSPERTSRPASWIALARSPRRVAAIVGVVVLAVAGALIWTSTSSSTRPNRNTTTEASAWLCVARDGGSVFIRGRQRINGVIVNLPPASYVEVRFDLRGRDVAGRSDSVGVMRIDAPWPTSQMPTRGELWAGTSGANVRQVGVGATRCQVGTATSRPACVTGAASRSIRVPNVVGRRLGDAVALVRAQGLAVVGRGVPAGDETDDAVRVTAQEPPPDSNVVAGACIGFRTHHASHR